MNFLYAHTYTLSIYKLNLESDTAVGSMHSCDSRRKEKERECVRVCVSLRKGTAAAAAATKCKSINVG